MFYNLGVRISPFNGGAGGQKSNSPVLSLWIWTFPPHETDKLLIMDSSFGLLTK